MSKALQFVVSCLMVMVIMTSPVLSIAPAGKVFGLAQYAAENSVGAKQIIQQAIRDIQALGYPNPDQLPNYEERIEFAVFALQQALDGNFETDNSINNDIVFDLSLKAIKKLDFYAKYPGASDGLSKPGIKYN
ncbi:MAG: hypothetical protein ACOX2G_11765 [Bacillota bacterium]